MAFTTNAKRRSFTTKDGAELSYLELGEGPPMVMIHGWSQTGLQWFNQIEEFSKTHRVLALDLRSHGESSKIDNGYGVYRMAQDVKEFMVGLELEPAVLMGHSMGCTILWVLWDLYGDEGIEKFIFVDNTPYASDNPTQTGDSQIHTARGMTPDALFQMALGWASDADGSFTRQFLRQQFTPNCPDDIFEEALKLNMLLPRQHAADMMVNGVQLDLRDVVSRVTVPSLYIGGRNSIVNWKSVVWQAEQAKQGSYEIFEEDEGGAHFMFLENSTKFNQVVREFLN
jgi:non-heme chloroperoxidase